MYNFEELRNEGKQAMSEWRKKKFSPITLSELIPVTENGFKFSFKEIEEAFPDITGAMAKSPQDTEYHNEGDVWTHTKMVMEEMFASDFYQNANTETQHILFWATLLHDVSKPITVDLDIDKNKIGNANHSIKGATDARFFMWKNGFSKEMRESVARIIRYHQKPFHWHKEMSKFDLHKLSQNLPLDHLIAMARADGKGRRYLLDNDERIAKTLENLYFMEEMAKEENCYSNPWGHNFENSMARKIYFDANGKSYVDRPVFETESSEVIFLSGLPASGKNYWVEKFGMGMPVFNYDAAREKFGLKNGKDGQAVQYVKEEMKKLLGKKKPFIINATHINEVLRAKTLMLLGAYNAKIRIVHLEENYNVLVERNENRHDNIKSNIILKMARNWSPPTPLEGHEVMWWNMKEGKPEYIDFLTTKKMTDNKVWNFK